MKKLKVNVYSPDEIEKVVSELQKSDDTEKKIHKYLGKVAKFTADSIDGLNPVAIATYEDRGDNTFAVIVYSGASNGAGGAELFFNEFGTGEYVRRPSSYTPNEPFDSLIESGSWSDSEFGKGTWSAWLAAGRPGAYRYNTTASNSVDKTVQELENGKAIDLAHEVWK